MEVFCDVHDIVWDTEASPGCLECLEIPEYRSSGAGGLITITGGTPSGSGTGGSITITGGTGGAGNSGSVVFENNVFIRAVEPSNLVTITDPGGERFRIDRDGNIYAYGRLAATDLEVRNAARAMCNLEPIPIPEEKARWGWADVAAAAWIATFAAQIWAWVYQ